MVRLREDSAGWTLEQVLVTLQQREETPFLELCEGIAGRFPTPTGRRGNGTRAGARPGRRWTC
jgi:hypothetical protein